MHPNSFRTALTLYRDGTLSLSQSARQAGRSEAAMAAALDAEDGAPVRSARDGIDAPAAGPGPADAD